ncbi:LysR family transcriptional regulator [Neiella marina]|uniref:LysR family transcriptional regulator n=1 Tax=Neiella holothuriorum TaxID=2870530 RepID=A0ABS7EB84_9GAMM|nr:LysR family transcriptional regulator [Neiella holothuriorum]MBW8189485.1 LysR family transcriptional regulator [Neiella holothuriorum]
MKTRSDDLSLLLSVIDCGGFSAAAEQLGLQVARVSRAVSRIERQLQMTLLNRTTRRIELTEEGATFVDTVRQGLSTLALAEEQLHSYDEQPSGRVRLDAASPFALHQLVPLMRPFHQLYPHVQVELTANEGNIDLLKNQVDVAIRIGRLEDSNLHARLLGRSPLMLVASPDYLEQQGAPLEVTELQQHQLLGFVNNRLLNRWPVEPQLVINPHLSASSGEVVRQLALADNGIACLSRFMVADDVASGRLKVVLADAVVAGNDREMVHAVYYRSSQLAPRVQVLLDFMQQHLTL